MIMKLYAIKDALTGNYMAPFPATNDATAIRSIEADMVRNPSGLMFTHANDYGLFHVGDFEQDTGNIVVPDSPWHVCALLGIRSSLQDRLDNISNDE